MVTLKCLECSKEFEAQRSSAKFCSPKCRVDYNRKSGEEKNVVSLKDVVTPEVVNAARVEIEKHAFPTNISPELKEVVYGIEPETAPKPEKVALPKANGIMLGADYLAALPKTTFQKLLIEFNSLIDEQPPIKQVEAKLYELIEKSQHPDLNARQSEAIRSRCINYLTGQYGKKKQ